MIMGQSEDAQIQLSVKLTGTLNYQESEHQLVYPHDLALQEQCVINAALRCLHCN